MDMLHLFDAVAQPVFLVRDGLVTFCNDAAKKLLMEESSPASDYLQSPLAPDGGQQSVSVCIGKQTMHAVAQPFDDGMLVVVEQPPAAADNFALLNTAQALRGPLSLIFAATDPLIPLLQSAEDPSVRRYTGVIHRSLYQLLRATEMLELYAQAESGDLTPLVSCVDLCELLTELYQHAKPLLQTAQKNLTLSVPSGALYAPIDRRLMQKALLFLISNAAKFSPPDGEIRVRLTRGSRTAVIRIEDDGDGMSSGELSTAFSHFSDVPHLRDPRDGVGLGLLLAETILRLHNGRLLLQSTPANGTSVTCELPLGSKTDRREKKDPIGMLRSPNISKYLERPSGGFKTELVALSDVLPSSVYDPGSF